MPSLKQRITQFSRSPQGRSLLQQVKQRLGNDKGSSRRGGRGGSRRRGRG